MKLRTLLSGPRSWLLMAPAFAVFTYIMWLALISWSTVPLVDGWPVYNRVMMYLNGEISLVKFLLTPHGSHPNPVVYSLYLIDHFIGGRQLLPHLVQVACIALTALFSSFFTYNAIVERAGHHKALLGAALALIAVPTLSIESLAEYQSVLTSATLVYVVTLVAFAHVLKNDRREMDTALILLSCLFAIFHGSGLMFGLILFTEHMVIGRWRPSKLLSVAPACVFLVWQHFWLPPGSGEMMAVKQVILGLNFQRVSDLVLGVSAFYATPFWPLASSRDMFPVIEAVGFVVSLVGLGWAALVLTLWRKTASASATGLAFVALFIGLQAASASLLWEGRAVLGVAGTLGSVMAVLTSSRYAIVATVACAITIVAFLQFPGRWLGVTLAGMMTASLMVVDLTVFKQHEGLMDNLNLASTALLVDATFTDKEAQDMWPGVAGDWYWPSQLKKLQAYMNANRLGYAAGVPALGTDSELYWQTQIRGLAEEPTSVPNMCVVSGSILTFPRGIMMRPATLGVADSSGQVIGAVRIPRTVDPALIRGYVRCQPGVPHKDLRVLVVRPFGKSGR